MSVGFVSRVTTWLRRRVPNAILNIESVEVFGLVFVRVVSVQVDRLLLEVFGDDGGVGCFWLVINSDNVVICRCRYVCEDVLEELDIAINIGVRKKVRGPLHLV